MGLAPWHSAWNNEEEEEEEEALSTVMAGSLMKEEEEGGLRVNWEKLRMNGTRLAGYKAHMFFLYGV
jgi:hypothetical protein